MIDYLKSLWDYAKPRDGLRQFNPYKFVTISVVITIVAVIGGWMVGHAIFKVSDNNDLYADEAVAPQTETANSPQIINNALQDTAKSASPTPVDSTRIQSVIHTIAAGESIWSIAKTNGVTADTLASANPKYAQASLKTGDTLRIPSQNGLYHNVQSGQSIQKISQIYSISVDKITQANGISASEQLAKNQELFIPGAKPQVSLLASRTGFEWPADGHLTSGFGYRTHPMGGGTRFHRGVDIAADYGTTIVAAQSGKVIHGDWYGLMGKAVIIQHSNDYMTYYAHCSQILVKPGQFVKKGQIIARVGSTGLSTGPHVHFEIRRNGVPINPMRFLH